ncbi:MAG: aromatic ring-hydroxylating dioxygenase subunit alpha [Parvularculaceae bacterium]
MSDQSGSPGAELYLRNLWYCAAPSRAVKRGRMIGKIFMDQPYLIGRTREGAAFALRDLCPHRGVRLSEGAFDGEEVACPFHGWRFGVDGRCRRIPSLVDGQAAALDKISVERFPVREHQGLIWIYLARRESAGADGPQEPASASFEIPEIGDARPKVVTPLIFETDIDNAVYGLLDPAHTPYVHQSALWRRPTRLREKSKAYAPSPLGFTMTRHPPSSNSTIYKLLGGAPTTEISFRLPGVRLEHIKIGRRYVCNLTAMTPMSADRTEVTNVLYWSDGLMDLARPFMAQYARKFLGQDQHIVGLQNETKQFAPKMMLIHDADVPQKWYQALKRAWRSCGECEEQFQTPLKPAVLRWRT